MFTKYTGFVLTCELRMLLFPSLQDQGGREGVGGRELSGYEASWQKLQPVVHCGDNAMTLTVRRRRAVQLQLGRGEAANHGSITPGDVVVSSFTLEMQHAQNSSKWCGL